MHRRRPGGGVRTGRLTVVPAAAGAGDRTVDRIVALAVPAFFALVTEPLFLLADAAIVGHLGTPELAGLGVASVVLRFAVGMCVFLAYGTTAAVAREVGAGQRGRRPRPGGRRALARRARRRRGHRRPASRSPARSSRFFDIARRRGRRRRRRTSGSAGSGLTADARSCSPPPGSCAGCTTPAPRSSSRWSRNLVNIALNVLLVYGLDLGIAGSALGTDLAQLAAAAALVAVVVRGARRERASLRPDLPGVRRSARAGGPLVVRTLSLQACLVAMTWAPPTWARPRSPPTSWR